MNPTVFVHEKALCESEEIGSRTRVWAFAHVMKGARVGEDCNIGDHAFVEGGAVVGSRVTIKNGVQIWDGVTVKDEVFLGPGVVFTNDLSPRSAFKKPRDQWLSTVVERGASIGANATIVSGITIGEHAFIGAGAVVVRDVPAYALVVGNPARAKGWMCACGEKLAVVVGARDPSSPVVVCSCGRRYRLEGGRLGLVAPTTTAGL
jgi:acetyltransferase-like isoleucine patch superfamily enzyme